MGEKDQKMKSMKSYFYRAAQKVYLVDLDSLLINTVAYTSDSTPEKTAAKVKTLLEAGASPDATQDITRSELREVGYALAVGGIDFPYRHALGLALENGQTAAVKLLLAAGANVGTLSYLDMEANAGADIILGYMAANNLLVRHEKIADMLRLQSIRFLGMQKPKAPAPAVK